MPVVTLKYASVELRDRLAARLLEAFPELAHDLCIARNLECGEGVARAHVDSTPEIDDTKLSAIKNVVDELVTVVPRPGFFEPRPCVILRADSKGLADDLKAALAKLPLDPDFNVRFRWIVYDCRLLDGTPAPYAEFHPEFPTYTIGDRRNEKAILQVCDTEVWRDDRLVRFIPKPN